MRTFLLALSLLLSAHALAQDRLPVFLRATIDENDAVGRQLVYEIKEAVRASASFRLVDATEWPYLKVVIVTLKDGEATAAGLTFLYDDTSMPLGGAYITASVQTCGRNRVTACARSTLASIDEAAENLKKRERASYISLVGSKSR
jgi:hypothetical protein